jgi:hypothetical protein
MGEALMDRGRDDDLMRRVERLEREAGRWRGLALAGAALLGFVVLSGATPQSSGPAVEDVRARQFTLVDPGGSTRAVLGMGSTGAAGLELYDRAGIVLTQLTVGPNGVPQLTLLDRSATGRAVLGLDPDGSPHLTLLDERSGTRAVLGHTSIEGGGTGPTVRRSAASLILADKDGKVLFKAP